MILILFTFNLIYFLVFLFFGCSFKKGLKCYKLALSYYAKNETLTFYFIIFYWLTHIN